MPTGTTLNLAGIRQRKGISLEDIAHTTKIGMHYLQAIEREEFRKLPGGVYNCSYLKQYARAIDIQEAELLGYYRTVAEA